MILMNFLFKKKSTLTLFLVAFIYCANVVAQVKITNTPSSTDSTSIFQVESDDGTIFHINVVDGKVGVNTVNPTADLDVNGNMKIRFLESGLVTDSLLTVDQDGDIRMISVGRLMETFGVMNSDRQQLSLDGNTLMLENGGSIDLSPFLDDTDTDDQAISLDENNVLTLEDGGTVDLSAFLDNTDEQEITLDGNTLMLENGGSIDLSPFLDDTDTDEQTLSLNGNTLTLENGGTVDLSQFLDNTDTDDQTLSLNGNNLSLENGGSVDLSTVLVGGPKIFATGRHGSNQLNNTQSIPGFNSTITRVSQGLFDISFPNIGSDNYIIQLTPEDCGGNCPDNGGAGYDDPTVAYIGSSITSTGFRVRAGDSDNGINNLDLADIGFMYSVIQLPSSSSNSSSSSILPTGTQTADFNATELADENTNSPWQLGFTGPSYAGSFNYEIFLNDVPYTLNNFDLGDHTMIENDNGDGTFDYLFTSTSPISGYNQYRQITADPPAPTPSGSTGTGLACGCVSFYIVP